MFTCPEKKPPTNEEKTKRERVRTKNAQLSQKWKMSLHCLCRKRIFVAFVISNARKKNGSMFFVQFVWLTLYWVSNQANTCPRRLCSYEPIKKGYFVPAYTICEYIKEVESDGERERKREKGRDTNRRQ